MTPAENVRGAILRALPRIAHYGRYWRDIVDPLETVGFIAEPSRTLRRAAPDKIRAQKRRDP